MSAILVDTEQIRLGQHKGSALRGALLHALRSGFCANPGLKSCSVCSIRGSCPVCFLASTIDDDGGRGIDAPRPYVIRPPIDGKRTYEPGERLTFDLVLFSRALSLFPYVILAAKRMGEAGLGVNRGQFELREVWAVEPVGGSQQRILRQGDDLVKAPNIPIVHAEVVSAAEWLQRGASRRSTEVDRDPPSAVNPRALETVLDAQSSMKAEAFAPSESSSVKLRFRTLLRLVTSGRLVHRLSFATLMRRLFERLSVLWDAYAEEPLALDFAALLASAEGVRAMEDTTRWIEMDRYSSRQKRQMPMGGLMGQITFDGDLRPFLPWLVWGSIAHVGKYATMGNGWYELMVEGRESRELRVETYRRWVWGVHREA